MHPGILGYHQRDSFMFWNGFQVHQHCPELWGWLCLTIITTFFKAMLDDSLTQKWYWYIGTSDAVPKVEKLIKFLNHLNRTLTSKPVDTRPTPKKPATAKPSSGKPTWSKPPKDRYRLLILLIAGYVETGNISSISVTLLNEWKFPPGDNMSQTQAFVSIVWFPGTALSNAIVDTSAERAWGSIIPLFIWKKHPSGQLQRLLSTKIERQLCPLAIQPCPLKLH